MIETSRQTQTTDCLLRYEPHRLQEAGTFHGSASGFYPPILVTDDQIQQMLAQVPALLKQERIVALYREFADEDRAMANEGLDDYGRGLALCDSE